MELLYFTHPVFWEHDTPFGHPERPARLDAVEAGVTRSGLPVRRVEAPPVGRAELEAIHLPEHIDAIDRFCRQGGGHLDPDTVASERSWEAALRAAGAGGEAVRLLQRAPVGTTALLAVRPPGHHALPARAMGFCLFNNVAVTAAELASTGARVAIVDWDVHHGNGTQEVFFSDSRVLYLSLHQFPLYPGTGRIDERGSGQILNLPFPPGTAGDVYRAAFELVVVPVLERFQPDWLLISAGYDALASDPLAELELVPSDYGWMARALTTVVPSRRVIVFLEGGYHLAEMERAVSETVRGLLGVPGSDEQPGTSPPEAWEVLAAAMKLIGSDRGPS